MKIYIHSCHAALEFDQSKLFIHLGHEVSGRFDVGSLQRPKVSGITDQCSDDYQDADVIVLHQTGDFEDQAIRYTAEGKNVVVNVFGQGSPVQHSKLINAMVSCPNIWLVPYSLNCQRKLETIANVLIKNDAEDVKRRIRMIRFGKFLDDYESWSGGYPRVLIVCNDIQNRGTSCGFEIVNELFHTGIPLEVVGHNTEVLEYGLGEIAWEALQQRYRRNIALFVPGTRPAPYVLSMIEGLCTGIPVICYDNGCGIADEELWVKTVKGIDHARHELEMCLLDNDHRVWMGKMSKTIAENHFDNAIIGGQWKKLLSEVVHG